MLGGTSDVEKGLSSTQRENTVIQLSIIVRMLAHRPTGPGRAPVGVPRQGFYCHDQRTPFPPPLRSNDTARRECEPSCCGTRPSNQIRSRLGYKEAANRLTAPPAAEPATASTAGASTTPAVGVPLVACGETGARGRRLGQLQSSKCRRNPRAELSWHLEKAMAWDTQLCTDICSDTNPRPNPLPRAQFMQIALFRPNHYHPLPAPLISSPVSVSVPVVVHTSGDLPLPVQHVSDASSPSLQHLPSFNRKSFANGA